MFYTKYFVEKLTTIFYIFFHNKIYKYFLKKFKTKLTRNMNYFSSDP